MGNLYSQHTYDAALLLKAAGLVAVSTDSLILDLGPGLVTGFMVLDVSAIESDSANEVFTVSLEGSNVAAMTSGSACLARKVFGQVVVPMDNPLIAPGRYSIPFHNVENGVLFRYIRISTAVAGTVATGINFLGFVAKM